jgi:acetyl-CoA synthase
MSMSRFVAAHAIQGANVLVGEAERVLNLTIADKGPDTPVSFPNTAYHLPTIFGMTGIAVENLGQLKDVITEARKLLHPVPEGEFVVDLGPVLECGLAALYAVEAIEGIRFAIADQPEPRPGLRLSGGTAYPGDDETGPVGHLNGPIDDVRLRSWGVQLVDGRISGVAVIVGAAKSNAVAVRMIRELQKRSILTLLCGASDGRSMIDQLIEEGVELGYDTYTVPFGADTLGAIYAVGFAVRAAMTFGGVKAGQGKEILKYNQDRVPAFVLALGGVDDFKVAAAAGALNFGFPIILDIAVPDIDQAGVKTSDPIVPSPWDELDGADDLEKAEAMVKRCMEVRGLKIKITEVPIPVAYGSAYEGEVVRRADLRVEFGGKYSRCFEYLSTAKMEDVVDGKVEVVGPGFEAVPAGGSMNVGVVVKVAGRQMQSDFEPVLERQIHYFVNGASGVQHVGQRDIAWVRVSNAAAEKGFSLADLGKILHARIHTDFGAIVDKVQVTIYTEPVAFEKNLEIAREVYDRRNKRLADLTDDKVEEFYSCTLCQSFAPNHVCVVSPQRLGLCGAYNWLDCKASYNINPTGPNQPIKLGSVVDPVKGYWEGTNDYAKIGSHGAIEQVSLYSIMENPMTACGCFECIVMLIPEANGVMVVSREDSSMTPTGMTFSTLAGIAGGGLQTPGVMGVGKYYLISPKFITADGGFKRVVWMSSVLKEGMAEELRVVAEREGDADLIEKIADERSVTSVEELLAWLEARNHPAMAMDPIF